MVSDHRPLLDLVRRVKSWISGAYWMSSIFSSGGASSSPDAVPGSPMFKLSRSKFAKLVDSSHHCPSPRSPWSTSYRSDEEDDVDESEKHFYSPMASGTSQDASDVEFYSFKSFNSSPLDSPCRAGDSPGTMNIALSVQEAAVFERSNDFEYDSVSIYQSQELESPSQPLDFESNDLIWSPPPPEDEEDDRENVFSDDDDDGLVAGFDPVFPCTDMRDVPFPFREKPVGSHKEQLRSTVQRHFRALVSQLLKAEGIQPGDDDDNCWLDIVSFLAWQAANYVRPDTSKGGSMDPGVYVKVKCVSSGDPGDSTLIKGVVCTKNLKHKRMMSQHKNPRILILGGALEFHKGSNNLASINTVLEQESDELKKAVAKIEAYRPNVLLVEKTVSSYAQQYLLAKEISLVLNVKRPVLERISRCTGAQIVPSVENLATTRLGQCELFRVEKVVEKSVSSNNLNKKSAKTLMFFEGCPRRLGCTVLLRGSSSDELRKVKHVVQLASFAAYHLSLETSFLADEGATFPKTSLNSSVPLPGQLVDVDDIMLKASDILTTSLPLEGDGNNATNKLAVKQLAPSSTFSVEIREGLDKAIPFESESVPSIGQSNTPKSCLLSDEFGTVDDLIGPPTGLSIQHSDSLSSVLTCSDLYDYSNLPVNLTSDEVECTGIPGGKDVTTEYFSAADPQSILVSFSSSSILKGTVCVRSQLFRIKFYGSFDKPLGRFLRDNLFDQTSCCRMCKEPAKAHVQCYTHKHGSLTISVKRLSSVRLPGERDGKIWMWHRCLKCKRKDGAPPAARRVLMSDAAWGLSFGKFLELSFSNNATANRVASCGHSLQKDCLRFYGFGSMVAFFRYSPVDILSVHLPPPILVFSYPLQREWIRREASEVYQKMEFLHAEVSDFLHNIEQMISSSSCAASKKVTSDHVKELKDLIQKEKNHYIVTLESAEVDPINSSQAINILDLNELRRCLLIDSYMWEHRLYQLQAMVSRKGLTSKVYPQLPDVSVEVKCEEWKDESLPKLGSTSEEMLSKSSGTPRKSVFAKNQGDYNLKFQEYQLSNLTESDLRVESLLGYGGQPSSSLVTSQLGGWDENVMDGEASFGRSSSFNSMPSPGSSLSEKIDLAWTGSGHLLTDSRTTACSFEGVAVNPGLEKLISRTARNSSFDSALRRCRIGLPPASTHLSSVKSFDAYIDFPGMTKDAIPNIRRLYSERSPKAMQNLNLFLSCKPSFVSSISHMVSEGARMLIPQTCHDEYVIAVYEKEPTTIICHAITSQEHTDFISNDLNQFQRVQSHDSFSRSCGSDEPRFWRGNHLVDTKEPHCKISFDDDLSIPSDKVKFSVTCYFAKQFDMLRKKCCPNQVEFVHSLSRCLQWSAQGGKSNVYFAKSFDERFIIKEIQKTELESFEEFAPEYFKYLLESINSGSPTCLAKVLGIYQVSAKHLKGGKDVKMDLMVMENLFFGRNISRIYDLKGSVRSRYNPDTTGDKVLFDVNLLEALRTKPIFLESKAKRRLERAVWNDTSFLASIDVMDYSLLVGVDDEKKELVIGIIDFMRQYTWDKHLESWVKSSGILGGSKNSSPTVISPKQYKKRFRKAMSNYFLTVPDQWTS